MVRETEISIHCTNIYSEGYEARQDLGSADMERQE